MCNVTITCVLLSYQISTFFLYENMNFALAHFEILRIEFAGLRMQAHTCAHTHIHTQHTTHTHKHTQTYMYACRFVHMCV